MQLHLPSRWYCHCLAPPIKVAIKLRLLSPPFLLVQQQHFVPVSASSFEVTFTQSSQKLIPCQRLWINGNLIQKWQWGAWNRRRGERRKGEEVNVGKGNRCTGWKGEFCTDSAALDAARLCVPVWLGFAVSWQTQSPVLAHSRCFSHRDEAAAAAAADAAARPLQDKLQQELLPSRPPHSTQSAGVSLAQCEDGCHSAGLQPGGAARLTICWRLVVNVKAQIE